MVATKQVLGVVIDFFRTSLVHDSNPGTIFVCQRYLDVEHVFESGNAVVKRTQLL